MHPKHNAFISRASELSSRMIAQGGNRTTLTIQQRKDFHNNPEAFSKFGKGSNEGIDSLLKYI